MPKRRWRSVAHELRARILYRADSFLASTPLAQGLLLLVLTCCVIGLWAALLAWAEPGPPRLAGEALWWSVTRFVDGGTMAGETGRARLVSLGVTTSGVLLMAFLTAAFASKMGERIQDLRAGSSPVVEREHLLVLGYDPKVGHIARQIARSGQTATLVVLALEDKPRIELALTHARRDARGRLRTVVRTGDPRREHALLRVAATHARGVLVIPPAGLDDEASVQWTLATLLALRKVLPRSFAGRVIVEVRYAAARELLMLATERGVAGPEAFDIEIVATDEVIAKTLAQSVRQEGVYLTLQRLLAFDACELYVDPVPSALEGLTFDEAHARIRGGVLVGIHRGRGSIVLSPSPAAGLRITRKDQLIVLAPRARAYHIDGTLPEALAPLPRGSRGRRAPRESIVVLGHSGTLPYLVGELDSVLPEGSHVRLVQGGTSMRARRELRAIAARARRIDVTCDPQRALSLVRAPDAALCAATGIVILGREGNDDEADDATSIATLLWLRHGLRARGVEQAKRIVTEVRDPRAAGYVENLEHDFLVSSELVAMLLAQQALAPDIAPVFAELLSANGAELQLVPRADYVADERATFADVMAAARARGEVALGVHVTRPASPVELNPPREWPVPEGDSVFVVIVGPRA